jgi:hypothetical protein
MSNPIVETTILSPGRFEVFSPHKDTAFPIPVDPSVCRFGFQVERWKCKTKTTSRNGSEFLMSAPDRFPKEYANMLAAKVLLGAHLPESLEEDGTMSFSLKRPIGGHGSVYCDVVFMDDQLRIMKGHHGSVYVCIRVPEVPR